MATKKPLRIGLIGYGFMGRTHSNAFRKVPNFFDLKYEPQLTAVCARNKDRAEAFASQWGYESVESDWRKLIDRDDIDVIDIAAPNNTKKFSVKGSAPNSPRIPSVPKYFLDIIFSSDYLPDQKNLIL